MLAAVVTSSCARRPAEAARDAGLVLLAASAVFWLTTSALSARYREYVSRLTLEANIQRFGQFGHVQYGWLDYVFSPTATPEQPVAALVTLVECGAGRAVAGQRRDGRGDGRSRSASGRDSGLLRGGVRRRHHRAGAFEGGEVSAARLAGPSLRSQGRGQNGCF